MYMHFRLSDFGTLFAKDGSDEGREDEREEYSLWLEAGSKAKHSTGREKKRKTIMLQYWHIAFTTPRFGSTSSRLPSYGFMV